MNNANTAIKSDPPITSDTLIDVPAGLTGVAVADTTIGDVRGSEGYYHYRGRSAVDLAAAATFESVAELVLGVPLLTERALPHGVVVTHGLRTAISSLGYALAPEPLYDLHVDRREELAVRLCGAMPTLVASVHHGHVVTPDAGLGHAADYLRMLVGKPPTAAHVRAIEQYLILTIDHGFNASTFAARVIASTGSDLGSCVTGAYGAFVGPLHGGAPGRVLDMLDEIGAADKAAAWVRRTLDRGERLMGFGHAVYRGPDPRADLLRSVARSFGGPRVDLAVAIESVALDELARRHPERALATNVEMWAAVVMEACGVPRTSMTATFAVSRTVGWCAHILEQAAARKLIRPAARYVGPLYSTAGSGSGNAGE